MLGFPGSLFVKRALLANDTAKCKLQSLRSFNSCEYVYVHRSEYAKATKKPERHVIQPQQQHSISVEANVVIICH